MLHNLAIAAEETARMPRVASNSEEADGYSLS